MNFFTNVGKGCKTFCQDLPGKLKNVKAETYIGLIIFILFGALMFAGGYFLQAKKISNLESQLSKIPPALRSDSQNSDNVLVTGTVVKVDTDKITIKKINNETAEYAFDSEMKVTANGKNINIGDVKPDNRVVIYLKKDKDNKQVVTKITLLAPK